MRAFPMYVGMNRLVRGPGGALDGVPHVRGDEPHAGAGKGHRDMRSPCTWG